METNKWTGWVGFAGWLMIIVGFIDFFEGLIAVIRDKYYVLTPQQIIVFDMTTWGWIMMIWGVLLIFAGWSLLARSSWARWFTIVLGSLSIIGQLGFLGASSYPLWSLTVIALLVFVLYALIVKWGDVRATVA
jgi:hypothetical protein